MRQQWLQKIVYQPRVPTPIVSSESEPDLFKEESDYLSDDVYQSDESDDSLKTYNNYFKKKTVKFIRKKRRKRKEVKPFDT